MESLRAATTQGLSRTFASGLAAHCELTFMSKEIADKLSPSDLRALHDLHNQVQEARPLTMVSALEFSVSDFYVNTAAGLFHSGSAERQI